VSAPADVDKNADLPPARPPSLLDSFTAKAANAIGGRWGRHAGVRSRGWWTPLRVLLAMTSFFLVLGYMQKSPCANGDWTGNKQYTHMCYSDVVPLYGDERLNIGAVPYRDTAIEYPALTGGFLWATAEITRGVLALKADWVPVVVFGAVNALLLALCGLLITAATAQTSRRRPYDAAIFALSPLLVIHAFSNWDLLAMAFASCALWAWSRDKPVAAGVMIGLGTAAKLYPVFLLIPLWILALRTRRYTETIWATIAAAAVWCTVNIPLALAYHDGWWEFYQFSKDRTTERSTFWAIFKTFSEGTNNPQDAAVWVPPGLAVALAVIAGLLIVVWLGLNAPVKPRLGQLAFLIVLAFVMTTKVWSPQYSLWLVPLLALARPRWRLNLVWQFTEIVVWFATLTLLLGLGQNQMQHGIGYGWLIGILLVRDALLLAIAAMIVREMWHPELDVVRTDGTDDPGGGCFDRAKDFYSHSARPLTNLSPSGLGPRNPH